MTCRLSFTRHLVRRLRKSERGTAFVLVEHNVEFVLELSDRVTVLDFGRVLVEGTPDDVRRVARQYLRGLRLAYIGDPSKLDQGLVRLF